MFVRNTPYDRINRGSDIIKKPELKNSPTIFDYINGDVKAAVLCLNYLRIKTETITVFPKISISSSRKTSTITVTI